MSIDSLNVIGKNIVGLTFEPPIFKQLRDFQIQQDWLKSVVDPPALKYIKEFQLQQNWFKKVVEFPMAKYMKDFQLRNDLLKGILESPFQKLAANLFQNSEIGRAFDSPVTRISNQLQAHKLSFPVSPLFLSLQSISKASSAYQNHFDAKKFLNFVDQTFPERSVVDILNRIDAVHNNLMTGTSDSDSILVEEVNAIAEMVSEQCKNLPSSVVSFEAMIGYLLTILTFLYCLHSGNVSEERLMNTMLADKTEIVHAISSLQPPADANRYYVVDRKVHIRVKPTLRSPSFGLIYPNQKVTLLKEGKKWIYIQYFDFKDGVPKTGWTCKKYLHLLK